MLANRLVSKPGVLRDVCDAAEVPRSARHDSPLSAVDRNTTDVGPGTVSMYSWGKFSCLCHKARRRQRESSVYGSIEVSLETTTQQHLPGCPVTRIVSEASNNRRFSLTYTGLRSLLKSAIQVSFVMPSGAGGWSLSSNITCYPTVDSHTAPAFRILSLLEYPARDGCLPKAVWRDKFIPSAISSILRLFQTQQASPRAVDACNRSLIHHLAHKIANLPYSDLESLKGQSESSPLLDLFQYLLLHQVPGNDFDVYGMSPISILFSRAYNIHPLTAAAADLLSQSNTEAHLATLSKPDPASFSMVMDLTGKRVDIEGIPILLCFLASSPKLAEAYGCGPLSLAILSNNLSHVEYLGRNHPATFAERNLFGHSPMHLAADKPLCLRLLVKISKASDIAQMDAPGECGLSALEAAVTLSGLRCRKGKMSASVCRRCRCAESAIILMKADCALPVHEDLERILDCASTRCKLRYVRHMRDRRDRLKQLGLDTLDPGEIQSLGLEAERALDFHAAEVVSCLHQRGVSLPEALAVSRGRILPVYQALYSVNHAPYFLRAGFEDTDWWFQVDKAEVDRFGGAPLDLPYLLWLVRHGTILSQLDSGSPKSIFAAHFLMHLIGLYLFTNQRFTKGTLWTAMGVDAELERELNMAMIRTEFHDACGCRCSDGGCTLLSFLFKGAFESHVWKNHIEVAGVQHRHLELAVAFVLDIQGSIGPLELRHYAGIVRFLTFAALNIRHSCCARSFYERDNADHVEQDFELALLEELVAEFEKELMDRLQESDQIAAIARFWDDWKVRMSKILDDFEKAELTQEERRGAEEIGVVWHRTRMGPEPPKVPQPKRVIDNPYHISTLDHWEYELLKIETGR